MSSTYYIAAIHVQFKHNLDFGYNSYTGISQLCTWKTTNQRARIKGHRKPYEKDRFRAVKNKMIPSCLDTHTSLVRLIARDLSGFYHNSTIIPFELTRGFYGELKRGSLSILRKRLRKSLTHPSPPRVVSGVNRLIRCKTMTVDLL